MNNTSNFTTKSGCSPYDATDTYVAVAVLSACSGAVSMVASLLVIAGILISKKYLFFIQRLILYLSVTVLINTSSVVMRLQRVATLGGHSDDHLYPLCVFTSFVDQTTSWSELIASCCITCSLLLNVLLLRSVEKLEKLYVFLIFVFPLFFNWVPFIKMSYGEAGAWCWIREEDENCNKFLFGSYLRFLLWYIPLYIILFILLTTYVFIVCRIQRLHKQWDGKFDPESKEKIAKMNKEFRPLVWYPLIYLILNIFSLTNRIHDAAASQPSLSLWVLHSFFSPLRGGFIALAYALDGQTLRRIGCSTICVMFRPGTAIGVSEYPATRAHSDSFMIVRNPRLNKNPSNSARDSEGRLSTDLPPQHMTLPILGNTGASDSDVQLREIGYVSLHA